MKVERWYDVFCAKCDRYLSADFKCGMQPTREWAIKEAKRVGFKTIDGQNICPICIEERNKENENSNKTRV